MGVFDDKKFEELDWISQATEPIDSMLNEVLASMPDELEIDFDLYLKMARDYSLDLSVDSVIQYHLANNSNAQYLSWEQRSALRPCFRFEMSPGTEINFETKTLNGSLKIIKVQSTMDEKILEDMLGREGVQAVQYMSYHQDSASRLNEVLEIIGHCDEALRTKSMRKKRVVLIKRLQNIFKNNEWNIKDTELANKVGTWIRGYVEHGNLAAWSNFCRLKVMTHKGQPIYSMEEMR